MLAGYGRGWQLYRKCNNSFRLFSKRSLVKKTVYRFSYHAIKATHSRRDRCTAEIYDHVTIDNLFCRVSLMLSDDRVIDHVTFIIKLNLSLLFVT